jgi:hypothetical protein
MDGCILTAHHTQLALTITDLETVVRFITMRSGDSTGPFLTERQHGFKHSRTHSLFTELSAQSVSRLETLFRLC